MFKAHKINTRKRCEICSVSNNDTRTRSMISLWCLYCNFEQISHIDDVSIVDFEKGPTITRQNLTTLSTANRQFKIFSVTLKDVHSVFVNNQAGNTMFKVNNRNTRTRC